MINLLGKLVLIILALLLLGLIIPAPASEPFVPSTWTGTDDQYFETGLFVIGGAFVALIGIIFLCVYPRGIIIGLAGIILFWGVVGLVALSHRDGGTALIHHLQK